MIPFKGININNFRFSFLLNNEIFQFDTKFCFPLFPMRRLLPVVKCLPLVLAT